MIMMCLVTNNVYRTMRIRVCHSEKADTGDMVVAIGLGLGGVCQLAGAHYGLWLVAKPIQGLWQDNFTSSTKAYWVLI